MGVQQTPFAWGTGGESAGLIYGEPETDNIGYELACAAEGLELGAWSPSPPKGVTGGTFPTRLQLSVGGRTFDVPATGTITEMGGGETVIVARFDDPAAVLKAMMGSRRLTTRTYDGQGGAPTPSKDQLARLAKECGVSL